MVQFFKSYIHKFSTSQFCCLYPQKLWTRECQILCLQGAISNLVSSASTKLCHFYIFALHFPTTCSSLNKVFMTFYGPIKIFSGGRFPKCHNNNKVPCQIVVKETIHWKRMNIKPTGMEQSVSAQVTLSSILFAAICQKTALGSHNIFLERSIFNILGDDQWDKKSKIDWASVFTQAKWCFLSISISS